ncbi:Phage major capsid protein, P2 family [compost metagenome]
MQKETRELFNAYRENLASENGTTSTASTFTAKPAIEQRAVATAQESHELLKGINMVGVESPEGQAVGISIGSPIAGRTNTDINPREPRNLLNLTEQNTYKCEKTEFDVALPYTMLDAWTQFPDFSKQIDRAIGERQALDRLTIGFNGTHVAAQTDRDTYPLLQDVNIGWLEKIRTKAPGQVKAAGGTPGKVTVGSTGDFRNLDALVYAAVQMLSPCHRKRPDLVVLIDRDLLHTKSLANAGGATDNINELALNRILTSGLIGGITHRDAPFFPDAKLLVTTLGNISIYYQKATLRRFIKDEPMINQVGDYQSLNEAYVIEDYGLVALVENIEFV